MTPRPVPTSVHLARLRKAAIVLSNDARKATAPRTRARLEAHAKTCYTVALHLDQLAKTLAETESYARYLERTRSL